MLNVSLSLKVEEEKYPCLKITSEGRVVLFTGPRTGLCLTQSSQGGTSLGYHSCTWVEEDFKPFIGSVTLSETKE